VQVKKSRIIVGLLLFTLLVLSPVFPGQEPKGSQKSKPAKININTVTVEELAALPGIGGVTATNIVQHRKISGPFRKIEELLVIHRISRKKFERLRERITVEEAPQEKTKT
jgi:competence protein ComEA